MIHRLRAYLGSIAYGIRQFAGSLLSFVGLRQLARFVVPLLVVVLVAAALLTARETMAILDSRPEVQRTTLADVASQSSVPRGRSIWFEFDAVLDASHYQTVTDQGTTFFYVARDPDDPSTGLLVRSSLNDAFIRQRVITAVIVDDEAFVEDARDRLGALPSGFDLDTARYLDEIASGGDPDQAFVPHDVAAEEAGTEVLVAGRVVSPETWGVCATDGGCEGDDGSYLYYFADPSGGAAFVLRSPHPPDAMPVRLQGLYQRDTFDLRTVLESDWFAGIDSEVPTERAFSAGSRPPIVVEASWTPTIVYAALAVLLLASLLAGYPVFGGGGSPAAARTLGVGESIDVSITGRLGRQHGTLALDHSPGSVERLAITDLALRMWRYGLLPRDLSRREAEERFVAEAGTDRDRLVLHERDQSALVPIGHSNETASVEVGRLYRIGGSQPAVHLRQGTTDAYLTVRSPDQRDRIAREVRAELDASAPVG